MKKYFASHVISMMVRPLNGHYQIVSGHNRTEAASRAGFDVIPAWVRDMDDEAAFMELILANAQGELSPLERGIHALGATEKGKHNGKSISAYAEQVGRPEPSVNQEVKAARVASSRLSVNFSDISDKCTHLSTIHAAPDACWSSLVKRMIAESWTVAQRLGGVRERGRGREGGALIQRPETAINYATCIRFRLSSLCFAHVPTTRALSLS